MSLFEITGSFEGKGYVLSAEELLGMLEDCEGGVEWTVREVDR